MREAENARKNRLEIVKALSHGQITKRDLFKWGIFTGLGLLADKNGLSPFARSAYAAVPTGTPPSPIPQGLKFKQPFRRLEEQQRLPLKPTSPFSSTVTGRTEVDYQFCHPNSTTPITNCLPGCRTSYHSDWDDPSNPHQAKYTNPVSGLGPCEGRPGLRSDGDYFAHQRWDDFKPQVGYLMSIGQVKAGSSFYPGGLPSQNANSVWSFGSRYNIDPNALASSGPGNKPTGYYGLQTGSIVAPLIKMRYNESVLMRVHNDTPVDRTLNGGFGRNEFSTHFHNAHNGAESDGACNAYHFPGTFYDYHYSAALARRDWQSYPQSMDSAFLANEATPLTNKAKHAWTPNGNGGLDPVQGDFREYQGTMWFHDHRFFFTAENVHKGNFGMINMYSGTDRGNEGITDGVNLKLPSGTDADWGNTKYDVNLAVSNPALDQNAQLFFDIFDTDGFLGDVLAVNGTYYPYMEVEKRRYRFRTLNAAMSRFIKLALVDQNGNPMPFHFIANDGNFVNKPILMSNATMDEQGVAERYDIVVDFARVPRGVTKLYLVNVLQQTNGRKPDGAVSLRQAMSGVSNDPAVGPIMEFRVGSLPAVADQSTNFFLNPNFGLTEQVPIQPAVRTRTIEFVRSKGDSRANPGNVCIPECGDIEQFPWSIKVNGQAAHSLNATRISALIPGPGEVEQWTLVNGGGGWDHPIHLHFEEAITLNRGGAPIPETELNVRKDVWRLRPSGKVTFQVRFGEFGGSYVNHCHNTVHEDFAMLLRYQLLKSADASDPQRLVTPVPIPTENGVNWHDSDVLPEGDPRLTKTTTVTSTSGKG